MSPLAPSLHHTTAAQRIWNGFATALHAAATAWHARRRRRSTQRALWALDDRTLRDMGLSRAEAGSLAAELTGAAPATRRHAMAAPAARGRR
ncbi:MAG: DUF1127 domain-containing protein [Burkholderiaceae bacterium]|jgi:uncharacterized protein YjiS (DUF1127 family)|nr:DUF1127 domain-containing protein [Burkholderiaceae bacterium]